MACLRAELVRKCGHRGSAECRRQGRAPARLRHKRARSILARDRYARLGVPFTPSPCSVWEEGSTDDHDHGVRPRRRRHADGAAIATFLAGYCGSTRRSYAADLRLFAAWCGEEKVPRFGVRRAHLEVFGHWMEGHGKMRPTVARRLSTLASFYRDCEHKG
jgi:hypothetical protein